MYMIFPFPLRCRAFLILEADAWAASLGRDGAGCRGRRGRVRGTALAATGEGGEEGQLKEHAVPPCFVLVIDDNLYGLMVDLSYI